MLSIAAAADPTNAGDGDGDDDGRTYCIYDRASYGEMIAVNENGYAFSFVNNLFFYWHVFFCW